MWGRRNKWFGGGLNLAREKLSMLISWKESNYSGRRDKFANRINYLGPPKHF